MIGGAGDGDEPAAGSDRARRAIVRPRLILFDLDDTLCDYAAARAVRLRLAFSAARHPALGGRSEADLERMVADSLEMHPHGADHFPELLRRHGVGDEGAAAAAIRWYRENRFHGLRLFPDAAPTLAALRWIEAPDGALVRRRIGVVTNGPADVQRDKVRLLGVDRLVDFVVISGEVGVWKPDPAIFAEALRLGETSAAEAVFVGDSPEFDVAGAVAAGIGAVWMNRSGEPWRWGRPPDAEVAGLSELVALLGGRPTRATTGDEDRAGAG